MEYVLLTGIIVFAILIYAIYSRSQHNKKVDLDFEQIESNEEKMILLQKQANKHLKGIDTTLDWFFWLLIIGIVLTVLSYFFGAIV
ncbi:hypothetical protein GUB10_11950 [Salegentibacter sp. BLCTC]|uniref:hypothetical protein n=1 Tax=Salegentibacter sp. BLCTC TaxID=2697368 RepID=UPI00187B2A12|nr:hypothetical protein [Salegentibacter sp. BLCTC]MBE7641048.1 hypothetical protein [Salegentibacter sp. BLCTC]